MQLNRVKFSFVKNFPRWLNDFANCKMLLRFHLKIIVDRNDCKENDLRRPEGTHVAEKRKIVAITKAMIILPIPIKR